MGSACSCNKRSLMPLQRTITRKICLCDSNHSSASCDYSPAILADDYTPNSMKVEGLRTNEKQANVNGGSPDQPIHKHSLEDEEKHENYLKDGSRIEEHNLSQEKAIAFLPLRRAHKHIFNDNLLESVRIDSSELSDIKEETVKQQVVFGNLEPSIEDIHKSIFVPSGPNTLVLIESDEVPSIVACKEENTITAEVRDEKFQRSYQDTKVEMVKAQVIQPEVHTTMLTPTKNSLESVCSRKVSTLDSNGRAIMHKNMLRKGSGKEAQGHLMNAGLSAQLEDTTVRSFYIEQEDRRKNSMIMQANDDLSQKLH